MKIHPGTLADVDKYIENHKNIDMEKMKIVYNILLNRMSKFKEVNSETKILEIGTGSGWFPILCYMDGLNCEGIEISPQLIEFANKLGSKYNAQLNINLKNVEENLGSQKYDIVIANSIFEHVEYWEKGINNVYNVLNPGGILFFTSTNKYSFKSGEYNFPFYGWFPNKFRYWLRIKKQGNDIMKLGIDYNQFTYRQLRQFFKKIGFLKVMDIIDLTEADDFNGLKKIIIKLCKHSPTFKSLVLTFLPVTEFICVK